MMMIFIIIKKESLSQLKIKNKYDCRYIVSGVNNQFFVVVYVINVSFVVVVVAGQEKWLDRQPLNLFCGNN